MKPLLVSSNQDIIRRCWAAFDLDTVEELVVVPDASVALTALSEPEAAFTHIIVDLGLPGSSGLIVCDTVGKSPEFAGLKLWAIDAGKNAGLARIAAQLGAEKTFNASEITKETVHPESQNGRVSNEGASDDPAETDAASEDTGSNKRAYSEKVRISGVRNCLSRRKFDSYFAKMSKPELFKTRVVVLEISNAATIFPKVTPDDFLEMLKFVARGVSDYFGDATSRFTYNGEGVFLCAFSDHSDFSAEKLVKAVQQASTLADHSTQLMLNKLKLKVGPVKRASGVFKSHPTEKTKQSARPSRQDKAIAATSPVVPKKPRVQTRLLTTDDTEAGVDRKMAQ